MLFDRRCCSSFALRHDSLLIRCIAENKDGWRCEDRGVRDFCPEHMSRSPVSLLFAARALGVVEYSSSPSGSFTICG
jgi:hypothetical protein